MLDFGLFIKISLREIRHAITISNRRRIQENRSKSLILFLFLQIYKNTLLVERFFVLRSKVKVHCFFLDHFGQHESLDRWQFAICVRMYVINQTEWKLTLLKSKQVEILIATTANIWHFISGLFPDPTSIERDIFFFRLTAKYEFN